MESPLCKCLICEEPYPQKELSFFYFPKEETSLKMWIKEIFPLLDDLKLKPANVIKNGVICERHFSEKDFSNSEMNSLVQNHCPDTENSTNEKDTFQCGRCKTQFQKLSQFMDHKRFLCAATKKVMKDLLENNASVEENIPPNLENTFLVSFENKQNATGQEVENKSEEMLQIISQNEQAENELVSYIVSDNGLLIGNVLDCTSLPGEVVLTPETSVLLTSDVEDVGSVFLNNTDNEVEVPVNGLVLTTDVTNYTDDGGVVFTYPIQNDVINNQVLLNSEDPNPESANQVYVTTDIPNKSAEPDATYTSVDVSDVNSSTDPSQVELPDPNLSALDNEETFDKQKKGVRLNIDRKEKIEVTLKTKLLCSYCDKTFLKPFNLQQHERIHTGERPFQCIVCGRAFSQKSNVRKHMARHKVWPHVKNTLNLNLDQSFSQDLPDQKTYSCQYCSSTFTSYSQHKRHLTVHSDLKVYRCIQKDCSETYGDLDEFLTHSKTHSSAEFQCHICLKAFTSLEELGAHQYDHDSTEKDKKDPEVKLKCEVCHAQFKTVASLKNHLAVDKHSYKCVHCQSVFNSERFLRRHLAVHIDRKFECQSCKKTFRTQKYLDQHVFVHSKEKPFSCDHCSKQFTSKYRLKRHLAIHLNEYFECPFKTYLGCDKTFYRKDKLRDHVATHSHCRLHSCTVCSKTYSSLVKLNQHMKKEHKGSKGKEVLKCITCSQTFRKHKQLVQHYCTVGDSKFKYRIRRLNRTKKWEKGSGNAETVSNIEIIMVPYVSDYKDGSDHNNMT